MSVDIPKGRFTAVTGVSGSGKSSLVRDVLEAEAMRRLLENLSMYERQGTREGTEAAAKAIEGLGPTLVLGASQRWSSGYAEGLGRPTATVGWASDLSRLLSIVLARGGARSCLGCAGTVVRTSARPEMPWRCTACEKEAVPLEPRHLNSQTPIAACPRCAGLGTVRIGDVSRLIVKPDQPICGGAMYSPGYFPRGYLCSAGTGGHMMLTALAARHGFDPKTTPWQDMPPAAQDAFLHGDPAPLVVEWKHGRREARWRGVLSELSGWDQGGLYTRGAVCADCGGKRLRREYLTVTLDGFDRADLHTMPLTELAGVLDRKPLEDAIAEEARGTAQHRLDFLGRVGLGYLHLDRTTGTLSAGEAQRIKLASVLGGGLLAMTVLLDEPTRGLHPSEVSALAEALEAVRDAGNTVVAVEHDGVLLSHADHVIEIGPAAGDRGGRVTYQGPSRELPAGPTADAIRGLFFPRCERRAPAGWMTVRGARANNLRGDTARIPLGVLAGVCGVSGSGKSTLVVDTIGLALAPPKITTSVALVPYEPGPHDAIENAPTTTLVVDQSRSSIVSAGLYLGVVAALRTAYARSDDAVASGLTEADFTAGCDACRAGQVVESMGFLPAVSRPCDACEGTGHRAEVRSITARGRTLAACEALTLDEIADTWGDIPAIGRPCRAAARLGLGYLVARQPGRSLSGGEAQRLKFARELAKTTTRPSLYVLDEPTAGLHARDVGVLLMALHEVVDDGHSVVVVDHDPALLAGCDWLLELGPGGGPDGGRLVAEGTPEELANAATATAPYIARALR